MIFRKIPRIFVLLLIVLPGGCASVVSGNETHTKITSIPTGAKCNLRGTGFETSVITPKALTLSAKASPISVACSVKGYQPKTERLIAESDGSIAGNILFGGLVGVAVDAANGAGMKYPERLSVILEPATSVAVTVGAPAENEFDARVRAIHRKWDNVIKDLGKTCTSEKSGAVGNCKELYAKANAKRKNEIQDVMIARSVDTVESVRPVRKPKFKNSPISDPPTVALTPVEFNRDKERITDVIKGYYDDNGCFYDLPNDSWGGFMDNISYLVLNRHVGDKFEVAASYSHIPYTSYGSESFHKSRFLIQKDGRHYKVINMWKEEKGWRIKSARFQIPASPR